MCSLRLFGHEKHESAVACPQARIPVFRCHIIRPPPCQYAGKNSSYTQLDYRAGTPQKQGRWYSAAVVLESPVFSHGPKKGVGSRATPFVKWAGGKRRLVATILQLAPTNFSRYVEPFVGGGAVALALGHKSMLLNDVNEELMGAYRAVRDTPRELIAELWRHKVAHDKDYYYQVRAQELGTATPNVVRAARLIYLNKTCYNGLYRVNRKGQFNVPIGRYSNPKIVDEEGLMAASRALAGAKLFSTDFGPFLQEHIRPGDFVYLDPPYVALGGYSDFNRYSPNQFGSDDQIRLRDLFESIAEAGAFPVLSNSLTEMTRELYAGHRILEVHMPRAISKSAGGRGTVAEILVAPNL